MNRLERSAHEPDTAIPGEPSPDDDARRPLPSPEGPPRAVLMMVRPRLLFLYWVTGGGGTGPGTAELRVETSSGSEPFREVDRQVFDFRAPSWYVTCAAVDCSVRVRLGMNDGGTFREVLVSNVLRVPREAPGPAPAAWSDAGEAARRGPRRPARVLAPGGAAAGAFPRVTATSPGSWAPSFQPRRSPPARVVRAEADLCLVLHSHLPFVRHPERERFLEENWLFEAIAETYLPLLDMFDHLAEDGVEARVTISLTATLMGMLRDPLLVWRFERHLERSCVLAGLEVARTRSDPRFGPVAGFYKDRLERLRHLFRTVYRRDLVGRFAALEAEGRIEIVACAATHGFLPHLASQPESVRAQIAVGVREHVRQIGRAPRGLWLPECAYFEGLDAILADHGIEYVFVDAHAVRNASSRPVLDLQAPLLTPAGVAAFARDEECSEQVWSSRHGYPGDPAYRDFYRDIGYDLDAATIGPFLDPSGERGFTGLKYHRITGPHDHKEPYRRDEAVRRVASHADDFVQNRARQAARLKEKNGRRPLLVAMYDSELFGHWWFEGPEWLEAVLRRLPAAGLAAVTPSAYLAAAPGLQIAEPASSSWGNGGYYEVWLGRSNDWVWPPVHDAARRMTDLAARPAGSDPLRHRLLQQMGRELLLAQASDWPFIMSHETAVGYARRRVSEHLARFDRLARQAETGRVDEAYLSALERRDNLFPSIDPADWRPA